jgi:hypothetical protein
LTLFLIDGHEGENMNTEKPAAKTCSAKSYWSLVLCLSIMQILLPILLRYLRPANSLDFSHYLPLGISSAFLWSSVLYHYSSSTLKKVITVWILSSLILIVTNMLGFVLFSKGTPYQMVLDVLGPGVFLMLFILPFIIWYRKKEMNK